MLLQGSLVLFSFVLSWMCTEQYVVGEQVDMEDQCLCDYGLQVPQKVRDRRRDELVSIQQRLGESFAASLVGREVDVLVVSAWSYAHSHFYLHLASFVICVKFDDACIIHLLHPHHVLSNSTCTASITPSTCHLCIMHIEHIFNNPYER